MQFGEFVFPFNPNKIQVLSNNNILNNICAVGLSHTRVNGRKPTLISCYGEFVGEHAATYYQNLLSLSSNGYTGVLSLPYHQPFYAVISNLKFTGQARENSINYYVEFIERIN